MSQQLLETWLDGIARMNKPRFFAFLLDRAGVSLDRALFPLLVRIGLHGRIGCVDLADRIGVDHSTASRQLARLEELGLIERVPAEHDRRVREAHITSEGRSMLDSIDRARAATLDEALESWTDEERESFSVLWRRFNESIERVVTGQAESRPGAAPRDEHP